MFKENSTKVQSTLPFISTGCLKWVTFFILLYFLFYDFLAPLRAQWEPDVRLTNNNATSNTNFNSARCIDVSGDSVHVVWHDERDGNEEIYYKRSTDGGISWGTDTRLTSNSGISWGPSESISGSSVHLVWEEYRDGNAEIYYKRSTDGGTSWGADRRLTNNSASSFVPSLSVSGLEVHVVWHDLRDGNREIYYKRSTDKGLSWGADTRLTNNTTESRQPCVSASGSNVSIVWQDDPDGNTEIYYKRSTDGGISWDAYKRLTINSASSVSPSVSGSNLTVSVAWTDNRDGDFEVYYKSSTDGGMNWGADYRLTSNSGGSWDPVSVSMPLGVVHITWYDERDGNSEIYYKRSLNGGISWGADTRLTNNSAASEWPSVTVSGPVVHAVWFDQRDGNPEIYYKRNPTGNIITSTIQTGFSIPEHFSLSQNYPNPFNPVTNLEFGISEFGLVVLKVFDILGNEVTTLVNERKNPGMYSVEFNGTNYPSGIYYYKLEARYKHAGSFVETKRMMLIK